jgi:hypothetical protein
MAKLHTLQDNFNDNSINTGLWGTNGNVSETNGQLKLTTTLSSSYNYIYSVDTYDLEDSWVSVQLVDVGNRDLNYLEAYLIQLQYDSNNNLTFWVDGNTLTASKLDSSSYTEVETDVYNSSTHKYFKIREDSGTVYFDYSSDGMVWNNFASTTVSFDLTTVRFYSTAGTSDTETEIAIIKIDNVNAIPLTSDFGLYIVGEADGSDAYKNLQISNDGSALRNRVYVRGGTYLSDTVTVKQVADGEQTVFYLPEKPHDITVAEGVTPKTVGIKNIDSFTDYDYLVSYQEKYVETDTAPSADTVMTFTYKYNIPILVAVEDKDSIEKYGQFEYVIFDRNITTVQQARDRAVAELEDYAESISSGSFETLETGFRAGQCIMIDIPNLGIDGKFVVKSVKATSLGGGKFRYTITVVSSELLGIIRFLVDLLESNKNSLDISIDEVVDEIATITGESFTLNEGTPTLTSHSGEYKYDSDADWDIAGWY